MLQFYKSKDKSVEKLKKNFCKKPQKAAQYFWWKPFFRKQNNEKLPLPTPKMNSTTKQITLNAVTGISQLVHTTPERNCLAEGHSYDNHMLHYLHGMHSTTRIKAILMVKVSELL